MTDNRPSLNDLHTPTRLLRVALDATLIAALALEYDRPEHTAAVRSRLALEHIEGALQALESAEPQLSYPPAEVARLAARVAKLEAVLKRVHADHPSAHSDEVWALIVDALAGDADFPPPMIVDDADPSAPSFVDLVDYLERPY